MGNNSSVEFKNIKGQKVLLILPKGRKQTRGGFERKEGKEREDGPAKLQFYCQARVTEVSREAGKVHREDWGWQKLSPELFA